VILTAESLKKEFKKRDKCSVPLKYNKQIREISKSISKINTEIKKVDNFKRDDLVLITSSTNEILNFNSNDIFKDYAIYWLIGKEKTIKKSTYYSYLSQFKNHILPFFGNIKISNMNNKIMQGFVLYVMSSEYDHPQSLKSTRDLIVTLRQCLMSLMNDKIIDYFNMKVKYPPQKLENKKTILSGEEEEKLRNTLYKYSENNSYCVGILIALQLGIRIGEVCGLQYKDINIDEQTISINKTVERIYNSATKKSELYIGSPKSLNSNRILPIPNNLYEILKKYVLNNNVKDKYFITNSFKPMEPRSFRKEYDKILKYINIPHMKFHGLRHTFATNCISKGVDYKTTSELLGHSDISTTLKLYVHSNIEQKRKAIDLLN
jgi:integrase